MSQLVFLLGSYYPNFSAVGYCAYQVQKCLSNDIKISVIALRSEASLPLEDDHEGVRILRIETPAMMRSNALRIEQDNRLAKFKLIVLRAMGALHRLISPVTIDRSLVSAYLARLNAMDPPPRALVPLVFPFESALAALEYKKCNPDVTLIPYFFDDFVDSGSLHVTKFAREIKRSRHIALEQQILANSDAALSMHPLRKHLEANFNQSLFDKVTFLEHPLLSRPLVASKKVDDGVIKLCFTGSLIRRVREPNYLLALLQALQNSDHVRVDFYTMGNAARLIEDQVFENGVKLFNHGRVSKAEADAAVGHADILLNIGEVQGKQVSSKVFEYMAQGKPIIHLAYIEEDVVTSILEKYPAALCLVQMKSRFQENVNLFNFFVSEFKNKGSISYEQVASIYPEALPQTTAAKIQQLLDNSFDQSQ